MKMENLLGILFIGVLAVLVIILALGLANLLSKSEKQPRRSNQLMRMRVIAQFIAIVILVAIGAGAGLVG